MLADLNVTFSTAITVFQAFQLILCTFAGVTFNSSALTDANCHAIRRS